MADKSSTDSSPKLGAFSVIALATGGMVGGGIYVALGVVVQASAQWAWLAFAIAGIVAVTSAHSYSRLSVHAGRSGGAFEFLEEMDREGLAGTLSWLLLAGYVLTIALYAYAFGQYVSHAFGGGGLMMRGLAVAAMVGLTGLNLLGLGKMTKVEIVIVIVNLVALVALGVSGLVNWEPSQLTAGIESKPISASLIGAAAIFVSYEGFQLLTYEYEEIKHAKTRFVPLLVGSAIAVVLIYIIVALGATMLMGADKTIASKDVSLAVAAKDAWGPLGLIVLTVAAAFATSAAINSTLFSSAKLAKRVAEDGELPSWFSKTNESGTPYAAIVGFGVLATTLAVTGSLSQLVEAASLVFLATFLTVNYICLRTIKSVWLVPLTGLIIGAVLGGLLVWRLASNAPISLSVVIVYAIAAYFVRPMILKRLT
ncbi:APC family permease [Henriciella sp. AS95]|uniref:APC family permease n=1 Tax=Henriciella sp. AS95 TaxID=3135782 RepID=UPI00316F72DD